MSRFEAFGAARRLLGNDLVTIDRLGTAMIETAHIILVGLASAALLLSGHLAVFGRPLSSVVQPAGLVPGIVYGVALAFAGPAILIRNSVRGRRIENRPWKFVLGGCVIAAGWSFFSGTVILYGVGEATRVAGLGTGIA